MTDPMPPLRRVADGVGPPSLAPSYRGRRMRAPQKAPVLALIDPVRCDTVIARKRDDVWRLDIVLQGAAESAFLSF